MGKSILDRGQFGKGNVRSELTLGVVAELEHSARLSAYSEFWQFYKGRHWSYKREDDQPVVTANFCRRIVNITCGWLLKRGFDVSIPDDPKTEDGDDSIERKFIEDALRNTWEKNGGKAWGIEAGQMGGVTGDLFLRPSWEADDDLEDPYVRVDVLPSHYVFPEFGGAHGVDRKKMVQCMVLFPQYTYKDTQFGKQRKSMEMNGEIWTRDEHHLIKNDNIIETHPNPYGEIPIVHIPNLQLAGEFYGLSDLVDLLELQRMVNEKMTDVSDIIDYHSSPVTIVEGMSVKKVEKGHNQMWGTKKGSKVYNLKLEGDLTAASSFLDRLERLMNMLSGVPKEAMGDIQNAANTSGVALALRFMSLTDIRDLKEATYGLGLRRINRLIMKTLYLKDEEFAIKWDDLKSKYPTSNLYRNEVTFNSPMPRDELIELEKSKAKMELRLTTRRIELKSMGKTEQEIKEILEEARKDIEREAASEFGFVPEGMEKDTSMFDGMEESFNYDKGGDGRSSNKTPQGAGKDQVVSNTAASKV